MPSLSPSDEATLARSPPAAPPARLARAPTRTACRCPGGTLAVGGVLAAIVLAVLDGAIANVALPTIARRPPGHAAASVWIVTGYQMALVMALLPARRSARAWAIGASSRGGVALFTVASALCALVAVAAVAGRGPLPAGPGQRRRHAAERRPAALHLSAPPARRRHRLERADGRRCPSAAGPTIGAAILSVASWPWLFAVNLPVGVAGAARRAGPAATRGHGAPPRPRRASALNAVVFGPLVRRRRPGCRRGRWLGGASDRGGGPRPRRAGPARDAARGAADPARPAARAARSGSR